MSEAASHPFPGGQALPFHEFAVPLEGATEGRLEIRGGAARLRVEAAPGSQDLLRSRFTGVSPEIHASGGRVIVRARFGLEDWLRSFFLGGPPAEPVRLEDWIRSFFDGDGYGGELRLTDAVPWHVSLRGGARDLEADLRG